MIGTAKRHALVLLGHASTLDKRTKQKRRGRPRGAEVSRALILRAFLQKSDALVFALGQKWGLPVSSELWTNPDFLKDELRSRKPQLTTAGIIEMTRLSRRTVVALLHELVKEDSLYVTIIDKKKVYEPRSLEECRKPLTIEGTQFRKKGQVERLQKLGLDVNWIPRGSGRPKRIPLIIDDKTLNQDEDVKLATKLMNLVHKGNLSAVENIASSTGMEFKQDGMVSFFYTTKPEQADKNGQADRIRKKINKAKKDQKQRRREEKAALGSLPLDTTEKDRITRNARLQ